MTPPAQHCEHECICAGYLLAKDRTPELNECLRRGCDHDTRSRPAAPDEITIPFEIASKINGILFVLATGGKIESQENRERARLAYNILNPALEQLREQSQQGGER